MKTNSVNILIKHDVLVQGRIAKKSVACPFDSRIFHSYHYCVTLLKMNTVHGKLFMKTNFVCMSFVFIKTSMYQYTVEL